MLQDEEFLFGPTVAAVRKLARGSERLRVEHELAWLNNKFSLGGDTGEDPYRKWGLARHLDIYAAGERGGEGRPVWTTVTEDIATFARELQADLPVSRVVNDDMVRRFATYSTAESRQPHFYSTLLLFFVNAFELDDGLQGRMAEWLPTSERHMIRHIVEQRLQPLIDGAEPFEKAPLDPSVQRLAMGFAYKKDNLSAFEEFFSAFQSPTDKCAHFAGYRSGLNIAEGLVKSFLVLIPPRERDYYTFAHFYEVPSKGVQKRVSRGFVLPLEEGVYLVGGQRLLTAKYGPFMALDVVALSWKDLSLCEPHFSGLTLSTNYDSDQIVGRIAFRATPIARSTSFPKALDRVPLAGLAEDIARDLEAEKDLEPRCFDFRSPDLQAAELLNLTNNIATRWIVAPGFMSRPSGDQESHPLDRSFVEYQLTRLFGTHESPKFQARDGHPFEFWHDIRFGMVGRDR